MAFGIRHSALLPILAALLFLPGLVGAQTSQVPGLISYQGIVTDTSGVLVGNAAPVNREVIFRIWDSSTASTTDNIVYSERQVVTISKGEFSVLIGQGAALTTTPLGFSETAKGPPTVTIGSAFAGSGRYLGVTVDDGTATADVEITPRQQMVSTAFTIRAKEAETVVNGSISSNSLADTSVNSAKLAADAVTTLKLATDAVTTAKILNANITLAKLATDSVDSAKIVDGTIALGDLAANSVNSSKIVDLSIATADLADASVTAAKLGSDVGVWNLSSGNAFRTSGGVGIGTSLMSAGRKLTTAAQGICVGDEVTNGNSFLVFSLSATTNAYANIQAVKTQGASPTYGDIALNAVGGNVGIATNAPAHKLDVVGGTWPQLRIGLSPAAFTSRALKVGYNNTFGTDGGGAIMAEEQSNFYRDLYVSPYASGSNQGYVAIGQTTTPSHMLTVNGTCRSTSASFATSSDVRVKENIATVSGSLERVMRLRPVTFEYVKEYQLGRGGLEEKQTGFIAQEVQTVFPEMVTQAPEKVGDKEIKDFHVLNASSLAPHLVAAVQELTRRYDTEVKSLKEKLFMQEQRLAALEARDKARDAKLAAIEAMLDAAGSGDKPTLRNVSLKQ